VRDPLVHLDLRGNRLSGVVPPLPPTLLLQLDDDVAALRLVTGPPLLAPTASAVSVAASQVGRVVVSLFGLEDAHRGHLPAPAPAPGKKQAPAARRSGEEEEEEDRRQAGGPAASARVAGGVASAGEGRRRRLGRPAAWRPRGGAGAAAACGAGALALRATDRHSSVKMKKKWVGPTVGSPNRRPPNWGVG